MVDQVAVVPADDRRGVATSAASRAQARSEDGARGRSANIFRFLVIFSEKLSICPELSRAILKNSLLMPHCAAQNADRIFVIYFIERN